MALAELSVVEIHAALSLVESASLSVRSRRAGWRLAHARCLLELAFREAGGHTPVSLSAERDATTPALKYLAVSRLVDVFESFHRLGNDKPSLRELAHVLGISRQSVQACCRRAVKLGLLGRSSSKPMARYVLAELDGG